LDVTTKLISRVRTERTERTERINDPSIAWRPSAQANDPVHDLALY
jgi:hypothetical protein